MSDIWPIDQDLMSGTPQRKKKLSGNAPVGASNHYRTLEARSVINTLRIVHQNKGITCLQ
jgi:hypothetical protein